MNVNEFKATFCRGRKLPAVVYVSPGEALSLMNEINMLSLNPAERKRARHLADASLGLSLFGINVRWAQLN